MTDIRDNYFQYSLRHYDNPVCRTIEEFNEDLQRVISIKKLLNRNECAVRLVLNHIITMTNMFDRYASVVMLFYKIEDVHWSKLKTFLVYLNLMPDSIVELGIKSSDIPLDQKIISELRSI